LQASIEEMAAYGSIVYWRIPSRLPWVGHLFCAHDRLLLSCDPWSIFLTSIEDYGRTGSILASFALQNCLLRFVPDSNQWQVNVFSENNDFAHIYLQ